MGSTAFQNGRTIASARKAGPRDLSRLLDSVLTIGAGLELQALLRRIVEAAVELVDARYGALGVLGERGGPLVNFITVGADAATYAAIGDLPRGRGLLAVPIRVRGEVIANLYLMTKTTGEVFTDVEEELAEGVAAAAGIAIDNARLYEHARLHEAAMAAMKEVATAVLAGIDQRSSIELIARQARQLLTADIATIALRDSTGEQFASAIRDGSMSEALRREGVMAAAVMADRVDRTLSVELVVDGHPFGILTVARAAPAPPFTLSEIEVGKSFVTQISAVLRQEQVRKQRQRTVLHEDQERIGRDLHDTVIQRLFATGLALQGAARLVTDADAQRSISKAVDELDRTIAHIRAVIFDVETSNGDRATSVRAQILELAHDAGRGLGFAPRTVFTGSVDTTVAGRLLTDLLATVQEVLSNVVRHADASRVDLELSVDDSVALLVADDGIGIPIDSHDGHGMANMRARAERLGGTLDVSRPASGGTEVRWRVPLLDR